MYEMVYHAIQYLCVPTVHMLGTICIQVSTYAYYRFNLWRAILGLATYRIYAVCPSDSVTLTCRKVYVIMYVYHHV